MTPTIMDRLVQLAILAICVVLIIIVPKFGIESIQHQDVWNPKFVDINSKLDALSKQLTDGNKSAAIDAKSNVVTYPPIVPLTNKKSEEGLDGAPLPKIKAKKPAVAKKPAPYQDQGIRIDLGEPYVPHKQNVQ